MDGDIERVLWTAEEIAGRISELAAEISDDFRRFPAPAAVVVGVATGAFLFLADIVRRMTLPIAVDFIRAESYGSGTQSSGAPVISWDVKIDVSGKHVILMAPRGRGRPYQGRPDPDDDVPDNNDDELEEEAPVHDNTGMRVLRGTTSKNFSNPEDTRLTTDLLRARWFQPWAYWKEVPADEREMLWQQFIGHFNCSNEDLPLIRRTWEATMQRRITGIISQERAEARRLAKSDDVMKMRQFKPSYMPQDVWNVLLDRTSEEAFKRRSEAARKNRLTLKEGEITKHTAGSIPFTTYRERMVSEDGTVPSQLEVFKRTHMKKGTESYVDARSKKFVEDYNAAASERCGESSSHPIDIDADAWMKAAGDSGKGRVYGFTLGDSPGVLSRAPSQSRASRVSHVSRGIRIRDDEASGGQPTQGSQEMLDAVEATVTRQITQMRTDLEASITSTMNAAMRKAMRYLKRKDKARDT